MKVQCKHTPLPPPANSQETLFNVIGGRWDINLALSSWKI